MATVQPKYNFGLLQTPMSNISGYESETSTDVFQRIPRQNVDHLLKGAGHASSKFPAASGLTSNTSSTSVAGVRKRGKGLGYTTPGSTSALRTPASRRTPGSLSYSTTTPRDSTTAVIVAIVEGRGLAKGEIGLASLDLKCPHLTLSQFSDTQTYVKTITKLQILQPIE
ncbi:mutS protein homolog 4-like, partial [Mizuhopecten yessoensis]